MSNRSTFVDDDEVGLAGLSSPSFGPPLGQTSNVIQFPSRVAAASMAWDDLGADDYFESIGTLAVTLVGQWSLPRILVWGAPGDLREEVSDPREL